MTSPAGELPDPAPAPARAGAGGGVLAHPDHPPSRAAAVRHALAVSLDFARRVYEKAGADDIFFLSGAIAFNVLVAIVPLLLATLGMAGFILRKQVADPTATLLDLVLKTLPPLSPVQQKYLHDMVAGLLEKSTSFLSIGTLFLVWFATRLIGTLRSALKAVFDLAQDRGIIAGKLYDIQMVFATGVLFTLNVGITVAAQVVAGLGMSRLGLQLRDPGSFQTIYVETVAFLSVWVMFLLIYRFLPARRTSWTVSIVAASFTSILFEVLKQLFSWYVVHLANYSSTYGNLATLVVLGIWIYYTSVVFILGGEVAQVWAMMRVRKRQKERLG